MINKKYDMTDTFKNRNPIKKALARRILSFLALCSFLFSAGCHSEYVSLNYSIHHGTCWNSDKTKIAFILSKCAYRSATGISRFPDGGLPEYLVRDVALYIYNTGDKSVSRAVEFNDLTKLIGHSRSSWKTKIAYTDSRVYYEVSPLMEWDWYLKLKSSADKRNMIEDLRKKYSRPYVFNEKTGKITEADASLFQSLIKKTRKASLTELSKKLAGLPLIELGLDIKKIKPKTDEEYIAETIYLKNDSSMARRAVVEQIISKLSKSEIKILLKKMDEHKNGLEGLEKTQYEIYSKDTYNAVKELL